MEIPIDDKALYEQMGRVIAYWTNIEHSLLALLNNAFETETGFQKREISLMYWSIISFEARLKMVSSVIQYRVIYHDDLWQEWNALQNHLTKKAKKRAEIAHGQVNYFGGFDRDGLFLVPNSGPTLSALRDLYSRAEYSGKEIIGIPNILSEEDVRCRADGMINTDNRL